MSQDACSNSMFPKNDNGAIMTNQSVSPVANSPLGNKNEEVSQGFLQAFIGNE